MATFQNCCNIKSKKIYLYLDSLSAVKNKIHFAGAKFVVFSWTD